MQPTSFRQKVTAMVALTTFVCSLAPAALASSHREAPLISGDSKADATDLYAFVSPDRPDTVTLIANYIPFENPNGGPNFSAPGDDVLYEIKIDNNGDAMQDITYQFRFTTTVKNGNTFLYNVGPVNSLSDANLNVSQTYTVTKVVGGQSTVIGTNLPVAPANVGPKSTPNYEALSNSAISLLTTGGRSFVGPVDDPFFVELGGLFDLLTIRKLPGNAGGGVDGLAGYNVHAMALQLPITEVTANYMRPTMTADANAVIGVWTTASRQSTRVLSTTGAASANSGDWVQVSRLGAPLVNEVVAPLAAKNLWNSSKPADDAQFANAVTNPEMGILLKAIYGIKVPPQGAFGTADQRDDLVAIFLTGIKGLTQPATVRPSEQLRLNLAVPVTANPNRMGVLGGDTQGYPNGRRLADDVTDISIQAVAGAAYPLFHPTFTPDALADQLGDGVPANDKAFRTTFPYLAVAFSGFDAGGVHMMTTAAPMMMTTGCMINNNLGVGATGQEVTCLQQALINKGYLMIAAPTGRYGALTAAAVAKWQLNSEIKATGYFGPLSRAAYAAMMQ